MTRYLVTGCAGFVGSHLVESLLAGGAEVRGVDNFSDFYALERKQANLAGALAHDRFDFVEADLAQADLSPLLDGVDGIFHLAAQPGVRGSWGESFSVYVRDNILVTQRLVEAAAESGLRIVLASSSSIYGNTSEYPTGEESATVPRSPYGVTKLCCEQLVQTYARSFALDAVLLRYFTVYGPRQRPDMAFARITEALAAGLTFHVNGTGEQTRDFTYVSDAVAATEVAMERAPAGAVYNVAGGTEASLREAIAACERLSGRELDVGYERAATGDVTRTAADTTRIATQLGWAPEVGLVEGLRAQLEWGGALSDVAVEARGQEARAG